MRSDRPPAILVEQVPRAFPGDPLDLSLDTAPFACCQGMRFVDELFQERRISSVEWTVLRDAIWPRHPQTGEPLLSFTAAK